VADDFAKYGLELVDFLIGAITPPDEVQKMIDERAGMGAIGDMQRYMAFKAARGIEEAAKNPGEAGNAAGLGLGAGIGMMMPGMIAGAMGAPGRAPAPAGTSVACPKCQTLVPEGAKFCGSCGTAMTASACPKCRAAVPIGARFCGNCGAVLAATTCPKCNAAVAPGSKFCGTCGNKIE
jgi:membrane protease subunit (stomatin/prohibitin family)